HRGDLWQTNTEETTTGDYDWECLSEPEEEDISVDATRHVSSFAETVSINKRVIELKAAFKAELPVGKTFVDKDTARRQIQSFSKANNIPFETFKSDKSYIKMICKPFGKYRAAKKGKDEEDIGTGEGLESVAQRLNRTTGRTGCSSFVYARTDARAVGQPWTIRNSCSEYNCHELTRPVYCLHNLDAEDQELAISLMRVVTTPSETLKMLGTRGVNNLISTDLTDNQQQFCRDNHINMWNFIKNVESSGHQVRYMTNANERICCVFFIHQHGIDEARKLSECVVIDATVKTNLHKVVLLNIVVVVPIAGCGKDLETGDRYRWSMNCFREIVRPVGESTGNLPKCFVTDKDEALLGAIKSVFPDSKQILCWIPFQRNFILRLKRYF
ncbi:hypothetical protein INT47_000257, partial [Mucor saturninus]